MYVLMNNKMKKLYLSNIENNKPIYNIHIDNSLKVTEDKARILADKYDLKIIKI